MRSRASVGQLAGADLAGAHGVGEVGQGGGAEVESSGVMGAQGRGRVGRGREAGQGLAEVDAEGHDGQGGNGDAVVHVALDVGPALGERAVDDEFVDHLVGDGGQGALAVAGGPGVPHRLQGRAPPEPAVELGVGVDVQVGRDHAPADGAHHVGVLGGDDEDPGHDLLALAAGLLDLGHRGGGRRRRSAS